MTTPSTVAIPAYNREVMIRGAIETALMQDVPGLEILVIDDHSTDRSFEVASSYTDPRLLVVRNETNQGLFGNFNRCVELAHGKYVRILCNDDRLTPGCLAREIAVMDRHPSVALLFSKGQRVSGRGVPIGPVGDHFPPGIYPGNDAVFGILWFFAHYGINPVTLPSGVLMRASACREAGRFDQRMLMNGDIDYFLRLLEYGDLAVVGDVGCEITVHDDQMSSRLSGNPAIIEENFSLVERHAKALEARGVHRRLVEQFAGLGLLASYHLRRHGRHEEARTFREVADRHCGSKPRLYLAAARCLWYRTLLKRLGVRRLQVEPRAPP